MSLFIGDEWILPWSSRQGAHTWACAKVPLESSKWSANGIFEMGSSVRWGMSRCRNSSQKVTPGGCDSLVSRGRFSHHWYIYEYKAFVCGILSSFVIRDDLWTNTSRYASGIGSLIKSACSRLVWSGWFSVRVILGVIPCMKHSFATPIWQSARRSNSSALSQENDSRTGVWPVTASKLTQNYFWKEKPLRWWSSATCFFIFWEIQRK